MRLAGFIFVLAVISMVTVAARAAELAGGKTAPISKEGVEFFEKHIRPVLVQHCYECHSTQSKKIKGGLVLDSRQGIAKGGENGSVVVPGDPEGSRLLTAIAWSDEDLQMLPKQKLRAQQVEKIQQWSRMGAPDPRDEGGAASKVAKRTTDIESGRTWWAFQPVVESAAPAVRRQDWPRKRIDSFILAKLEGKQLAPSPEADPRTLIQRVYLDL